MKHNFFEVGDRVMRVAPWVPGPVVGIEIGSVSLVTAVLNKDLAFLCDIEAYDDPMLWGGQWVQLDHPFFTSQEGTKRGWIHSNSLRLLAPRNIVTVTAFEYFDNKERI